MEYLQGENLADMIRREGALELGRALRLASQIAQGLVAALRAGVPHRDLKPQNVVVVGHDERVKVTDFGVARLWRTTMGGTRTRLDSVTLEYTAPEQLIGGDADDRTDVYGLGAVLYAMLTGAAPPTGASRGTEDSEDLWQAPQPVRELRPEVPVALEQALLRAMEREPERRQSSMHEFAEGLLDLAATVIERKTRQAAMPAVRESALEPSVPAPRAVNAPRNRASDRSVASRVVAPLSRAIGCLSGVAAGVSRAVAGGAWAVAGAVAGAMASLSSAVSGVSRAAAGVSRAVAGAAGAVAGGIAGLPSAVSGVSGAAAG